MGKTYGKYGKYVNKTVRTVWLKDWTVSFLMGLEKVSGQDDIKAYCEAKKAEYIAEIKGKSHQRAQQQGKELTETSWMNSAANNLSNVRKAIKLWQLDVVLDEDNSYPQQTKDGVVDQHLALLMLNFDKDFHKSRMQPTEEKKQVQRSNLVSISNVDGYQSVVGVLLESREWRSVAVGLIAATGRRVSEILKTAEFKQIGQFEVEFSGQLKAKGESRVYPTFTLVESHKVCDALLRLRRMPEIKELKRKTLAEVDSGCNSTVNSVVTEKFSEVIKPPVGESRLSTKNLRASYSAIAIYLFCPWKQEPSQFITERLGHASDATASSYQDYQVVGTDGKPLTRGVWVDRLGEEKEELAEKQGIYRIRMSHVVKDAIDNQDFLPFHDQLSRMSELLRLAEIGKQFEEGKLVKEVVRVETIVKEVPKPVEVLAKQETVEKPRPQKNIESMSNEELFGAKIPNSGTEKIRRAVAAIKVYNESQVEKRNWWAINTMSLKHLTNCRTSVVENYLKSDEGRLKVADYNALHGLGYHQNRGKGNITQYISLFDSSVG